ncbi:MAG: hypothetical protein UY84_C0001G0211 [Candidatus Adlerbacteria bacterium GW2011_GWA2_54_12]|uniref:Transposase IS200-like domain-containing protein n=3 Tax=Candidatus Adleribacteriota TaxID=1752736 RepID=A0A1F4XZY5_9BACT|nr:MAG: hypothetical protein UY83_C0003G0079 [Candidatus Adlerbacteria bacterium GW2011_GWA1_54_10]KKW36323.1 MAG: hypothetical protein UY84_C0001G0211 [Candidatus Adlerbacteria bacterium GW2011_GWA2_54_12]KKW37854.1 MAG: hypothetical protein UY86_C0003G0076 [Candidatus Adlerbacteria bacterium GW2011_GWB1_54_7]OGC87262.1 MAG: hypothetical protein A3B33_02820 [Candidatus Adlerbacteria bacterium RIFCSPLOWO2_01_FULL_54_16]
MRKDAPFAVGEMYHLYNRGAHKQSIFTTDSDYKRFLLLLHLSNSDCRVDVRETLRKYEGFDSAVIFKEEKPDKSLVDIFAYCLMPNHFHLVLREKKECGISKFTRKVFTGYSMYFNILHKHSGIIAQGAFKSRHVDDEPYFRYIFAYVHLNPLSLVFPDWEKIGITDGNTARNFLHSYRYSSFYDYISGNRPEGAVLSSDQAPDFLRTQNDLEELLKSYTGERFAKV